MSKIVTNNSEQAILKAAEEEFLERGFDGARTTSIAERAGVTHSMLHYFFRTKELLFDRVMSAKVEQLQESVAIVLEMEDMPLVEKIKEAVVRHFRFISENPRLPRFIVNELTSRPEYVEKIKTEGLPTLKKTIATLQAELDEAVRRGEVQQMDAATLLMDIIAVNIMPFLISPILDMIVDRFDMQAHLDARCQENVRIILSRIKENNN
jgi:AcrR family transcriptional regulator